uniref:PKS/mFAS DH domain-containing protein n=1 Tax=Timema bartmani TaxID=61472 RepID=A0A7R9F4Q1_9NEOP|nr:unnamed protein product [Timema bartmani]
MNANIICCFRLYNAGLQPKFNRLHQKVNYPVARGTPMIAPLIEWDHSTEWSVATFADIQHSLFRLSECRSLSDRLYDTCHCKYCKEHIHKDIWTHTSSADPHLSWYTQARLTEKEEKIKKEARQDGSQRSGECIVEVDLGKEEDQYLTGHNIDGRVLFPATGYLTLVWKTLAKLKGKSHEELPVVLENVQFHRATIMPKEGIIKFAINILDGSGEFELCESGSVTVSGRIYVPEDVEKETLELPTPTIPISDSKLLKLSTADIYKDLRLRGYDYSGVFRGILESDNKGVCGELAWENNWISFMDTMLQFSILGQSTRELYLPTRLQRVVINPSKQKQLGENEGVPVHMYRDIGIIKAGGVELRGMKASLAPRRQQAQAAPKLEKYAFVPYDRAGKTQSSTLDSNGREREQALTVSLQVVLENSGGALKLKVAELAGIRPADSLLAPDVVSILESEPIIHVEITVAGSRAEEYAKVESFTNLGMKFVNRDASSAPLDQNLHLVIGVDVLPQAIEVLDNLVASLKPGGFVLLEERITEEEDAIYKSGLELVSKQQARDRVFLLLRKSVECKYYIACVLPSQWSASIILPVFFPVSGVQVLYRLCCSQSVECNKPVVVEVTEKNYSWVERLKLTLKQSESEGQKVLVLAQGENMSGIVGLVNCIKQEPGGNNVRYVQLCNHLKLLHTQLKYKPLLVGNIVNLYRCVFLQDSKTPKFSISDSLYATQLKKDLVMNVYRNGVWGSYRHIRLDSHHDSALLQNELKRLMFQVEHAYINAMTRGDLASLRWIEGPLSFYCPEQNPNKELCHVYYSPLNFRDVMLASGKLPPDALPGDLAGQDCILGLEFAGRDTSGRRVMGMVPARGLATTILVDPTFLWEVPDKWTLEQASTIPVVYATSYYALVVRGQMRAGNTLLVHAGTGGVGQASIAVALHMGVTVFTTVSSQEKRDYLKKRFPQLTDSNELALFCPNRNIANSRDTTFEQHVLTETQGRGVDLVLNSLSEDKLQASVRCLAKDGHFLEIGKYDLSNNNPLGE